MPKVCSPWLWLADYGWLASFRWNPLWFQSNGGTVPSRLADGFRKCRPGYHYLQGGSAGVPMLGHRISTRKLVTVGPGNRNFENEKECITMPPYADLPTPFFYRVVVFIRLHFLPACRLDSKNERSVDTMFLLSTWYLWMYRGVWFFAVKIVVAKFSGKAMPHWKLAQWKAHLC